MKSCTREIVTGAEMISRAAVDAGVNFFAGYPITPASSIYTALLSKLQVEGKVALAAADEISALSLCIGASMRGAKAMTATAAPGLSLMTESIAYAFATETPVVIVLGQRLGPSTGAATQSAQGDISLVRNLISGGFEIPIFAIDSIQNSYRITTQAINCSETLRTPVILLTEKDTIMSSQDIELEQLKKIKITNRPLYKEDSNKQNTPYKTYNFTQAEDIPEFLAAGTGSSNRVVATASFHDKTGNLSKNSPEAFEVFDHLDKKIQNNIDKFSFYKLDQDSNSRILIISFLANTLSVQAAIQELRADGYRVNHLSLVTLFPIMDKVIKNALKNIDTVIIPEVNYSGQYADMLKHMFCKQKLIKINSATNLISPDEIIKTVQSCS